jgi:DNA polymerase-3 subunit epsilon
MTLFEPTWPSGSERYSATEPSWTHYRAIYLVIQEAKREFRWSSIEPSRSQEWTEMPAQHYAVIDFETTGLSPAHGARPTEIAVVRVRGGEIVDRFQSLMNPGVPIPWDIQQFTGITDAMVRRAPPVREVMAEAVRFAGGDPIVAHNASFDRKFWDAEAALPDGRPSTFLCSLLLARRLFPHAPNHKLGTLVATLRLPSSGRFHRALADAECTAHLFIRLQDEVRRVFDLEDCDCGLLLKMQGASKKQLGQCVARYLERMD